MVLLYCIALRTLSVFLYAATHWVSPFLYYYALVLILCPLR